MARSKCVKRGWNKLCKAGAVGIGSMALLLGPAWAGGTTTLSDVSYAGLGLGLPPHGPVLAGGHASGTGKTMAA